MAPPAAVHGAAAPRSRGGGSFRIMRSRNKEAKREELLQLQQERSDTFVTTSEASTPKSGSRRSIDMAPPPIQAPVNELERDIALLNDDGLEKACLLVKKILDQVTLGDSPPGNEEDAPMLVPLAAASSSNSNASTMSTSTSTASATGSPSSFDAHKLPPLPHRGYSRQRHVLPPSSSTPGALAAAASPSVNNPASLKSTDISPIMAPLSIGTDHASFLLSNDGNSNSNSTTRDPIDEEEDAESLAPPSVPSTPREHLAGEFDMSMPQNRSTHLRQQQRQLLHFHPTSDASAPNLMDAHYTVVDTAIPITKSEIIMGHVALTSLCTKTLDSVVGTAVEAANKAKLEETTTAMAQTGTMTNPTAAADVDEDEEEEDPGNSTSKVKELALARTPTAERLEDTSVVLSKRQRNRWFSRALGLHKKRDGSSTTGSITSTLTPLSHMPPVERLNWENESMVSGLTFGIGSMASIDQRRHSPVESVKESFFQVDRPDPPGIKTAEHNYDVKGSSELPPTPVAKTVDQLAHLFDTYDPEISREKAPIGSVAGDSVNGAPSSMLEDCVDAIFKLDDSDKSRNNENADESDSADDTSMGEEVLADYERKHPGVVGNIEDDDNVPSLETSLESKWYSSPHAENLRKAIISSLGALSPSTEDEDETILDSPENLLEVAFTENWDNDTSLIVDPENNENQSSLVDHDEEDNPDVDEDDTFAEVDKKVEEMKVLFRNVSLSSPGTKTNLGESKTVKSSKDLADSATLPPHNLGTTQQLEVTSEGESELLELPPSIARLDGKDFGSNIEQADISSPVGGHNPAHPVVSIPKGRIQMFGSEYARFLSSTPLSPVLLRPKKSKLMPSFSRKGGDYPEKALPPPPGSFPREALSSIASNAVSPLKHGNNMSTSVNLEDAPDAVLTGAITDIVVTHGMELPPKSYYRISQTGDGDDVHSLHKNVSSGKMPGRKLTRVYINVKKEANWDRAVQRPCVTAIAIIFPDRNEFVPPGFCVVRRYKSRASTQQGSSVKGKGDRESDTPGSPGPPGGVGTIPANLNFGSTGERVYLCYRRSREGNPITGLVPLQPSKSEPIPEGYTVLERTPRNNIADINSKAGPALFLAFRQRLSNLEPLRPLPLVLSVYNSNEASSNKKSKRRKRLSAYYCTGGTVVVSEVGRFHIMDRSTHPLLSPSSVTNRLSLIQASRLQRSSGGGSSVGTPGGGVQKSGYASSKYLASPNTPTSSYQMSHSDQKEKRGVLKDPNSSSPNIERKHGSQLSFYESSDYSSSPGVSRSSSFHDMGVGSASHDMESLESNSSSDMLGSQKASSEILLNSSFESTIIYDDVIEGTSPPTTPFDESQSQYTDKTPSSFVRGCVPGSVSSSVSSARRPKRRKNEKTIFMHQRGSVLQSCFDAMDFIPTVNTATPLETDKDRATLQARVAVITPILTTCYTHHGGSALVAVEGLSVLLNDSDFFKPDVEADDVPSSASDDIGSSRRITLLDIATQVVCDVATSTALETHFCSCINFVSDAIRYAGASLNTRTIGYALRCYLFVFYFGASVPTLSSWPKTVPHSYHAGRSKYRDRLIMNDASVDVQLLHEEPKKSGSKGVYFPGGAPQAAAVALKDLVSLVLGRLRTLTPSETGEIVSVLDEDGVGSGPFENFARSILSTIIDNAVNRVDAANYTQLALHQIHRSGGSELFWHDMMTSCGVGLFCDDDSLSQDLKHGYLVSFSLLANLVKVSSGKVRKVTQTHDLVPRDVASKLLSLELLLHFIEQWRDVAFPTNTDDCGKNEIGSDKSVKGPAVETMVYALRRLVVPGLLANTGSGLENSRVFRRILKIISELWCTNHYRNRMKMELGILIEHFVIKMLQLGPQVLSPQRLFDLQNGNKGRKRESSSSVLQDITSPLLPHQLDILVEIKKWFGSNPKDTLELFMNYDMEHNTSGFNGGTFPGAQWKLSQQLCGTLCTFAEKCGEIISEQIRITSINGGTSSHTSGGHQVSQASSGSGSIVRGEEITEMATVRDGARLLQEKAFDAIGQIAKSLMECAALASGENFHRFCGSLERTHDSEPETIHDQMFTTIAEGLEESDGEDEAYSVSSHSSIGSGPTKFSPRVVVGNWKQPFKRADGPSSSSTTNNELPPSPIRRHLSPMLPSTPLPGSARKPPPSSGQGAIVDYWLTSIAAERRKASLSPGTDQRSRVGHLGTLDSVAQQREAAILIAKPIRPNLGADGRPDLPPLSPRNIAGGANVNGAVVSNKTQMTKASSVTRENQQKTEETLSVAFEIMRTKSLKKALNYLIACNFLSPSPRDIASFLRIHQARLDSSVLGDYLGEGGKDGTEVEFWNLVRFNYVRAISFVGMNVEQG
eukprot:scaffold103454_cov58-Attheya_sp.AAC.1